MAIRLVNLALKSRNPAPFEEGFVWDVTVDVTKALPDPIDIVFTWADIQDAKRDIELDELEVGPFPLGMNRFELEIDAPDFDQLDPANILESTCVTASFRYRKTEFLHVAWVVDAKWVNPAYQDNMPEVITADMLLREVLLKKTVVTRDGVDWGDGTAEPPFATGSPSGTESDDDASSSTSTSSTAALPSQQQQDGKRPRDGEGTSQSTIGRTPVQPRASK